MFLGWAVAVLGKCFSLASGTATGLYWCQRRRIQKNAWHWSIVAEQHQEGCTLFKKSQTASGHFEKPSRRVFFSLEHVLPDLHFQTTIPKESNHPTTLSTVHSILHHDQPSLLFSTTWHSTAETGFEVHNTAFCTESTTISNHRDRYSCVYITIQISSRPWYEVHNNTWCLDKPTTRIQHI